MIKAIKAIVDTAGHYARPDVVRVMLNSPGGWNPTGTPYISGELPAMPRAALERSADRHGADMAQVAELADRAQLLIGPSK
ncbi:MAG TPA: hypothetical protein VHW71_16705 [Steroidobacteraceae bacterium]|jgi:hypothetical protein|nr:hypothetical protein [Steroidobacteraceae bacterium]